ASHYVTSEGSDQTFNYKIARGFDNERSIVKNTGFTRYSIPMNMQYRPSDRFRMFVNLSPALAKNSTGSGNAFRQTGVATSANTYSLAPVPSIFSVRMGAVDALNMTNYHM